MTELSPKTSRIWWHIGLGAVAAWCLYLGFLGPKVSVGPPQLEGTDRAQPAEYRWTLPTWTARRSTSGGIRGKSCS